MTAAELTQSELDAARIQAQKQWNANPCGALPTDAFDKAYFDRVEADRYRQQYWQRDWFNFASFGGKKVLEIGVGLGTGLRQFAKAGAECYGVDITDKHIELTRQNFAVNGFTVDVRKADASALPFTDATFDCVHSFGVLHHIPDVDIVLAEIRRVLKPGGVLLTSVYHKWSIHTFAFLARGVLNGTLMRHGLDAVLAQIERGADGIDIKPYVKLYSRAEWTAAIEEAGLKSIRSAVRQINFEGKKFLNVAGPLEEALGWYVCDVAQK